MVIKKIESEKKTEQKIIIILRKFFNNKQKNVYLKTDSSTRASVCHTHTHIYVGVFCGA